MATAPKQQYYEQDESASELAAKAADEAKKNLKYTRAQLVKEHGSKSAAVRFLDSLGKTRVEILAIMNEGYEGDEKMIYQHVRNILVTIVKKAIKK